MNDWKQKSIRFGLILTICGVLIMGCGYAMAGFHTEWLTNDESHHWYQTIYLGDGNFLIGIGH